jgi:hypothetical protein
MINISYTSFDNSRQIIRDYILEHRKSNPHYSVVDIGGSVVGWTRDIANVVVDLAESDSEYSLRFDLSRESEWVKLFDYVKHHGPFDLCICTHTLEDLYNPIPALEFMPKIALEGFITTPSIRAELSHVENNSYLGYIHHRWIFDQDSSGLVLTTKLGFLENYFPAQQWQDHCSNIMYHWKDSLPYSILMNGYLGPNIQSVVTQYAEFIKNSKSLR